MAVIEVKVNETVTVDGETRQVVGISKNTNGDPIILWQASKNTEGACAPYVWKEWRDGIPQDKRREI